jgi:hypothetical protein
MRNTMLHPLKYYITTLLTKLIDMRKIILMKCGKYGSVLWGEEV